MTDHLNKKRKDRWEETVEGIDFTHSSRLAWKTFNRLTSRSPKPPQCLVTANSIAEQLPTNCRFKNANKDHADAVKHYSSKLWQCPGADGFLSTPFSPEELSIVIGQLKSGKAQGPNNIPRSSFCTLAEFYILLLPPQRIHSQDLEVGYSHSSPQPKQAHRQPKELPPNFASLHPLQAPSPPGSNHRPPNYPMNRQVSTEDAAPSIRS